MTGTSNNRVCALLGSGFIGCGQLYPSTCPVDVDPEPTGNTAYTQLAMSSRFLCAILSQ